MLEQLAKEHQEISLEFLKLGSGEKLENAVKDGFVRFIAGVKSFISTKKEVTGSPSGRCAPAPILKQSALNTGYYNIKPLAVTIPQGFNGNYLEYVKTLNGVLDFVEDIEKDLLPSADKYISNLLVNPAKLKGISLLDSAPISATAIADNRARIGSYFDPQQIKNAVPFGALYTKIDDWIQTGTILDEIIARSGKLNPIEVQVRVENLSKKVDLLIIRMHEKPELFEVNAITAKDVADVVYGFALAADFYSAYLTFTVQAVKAYIDTNAKIAMQLKLSGG